MGNDRYEKGNPHMDKFFNELKRWSKRKHRLLGKYLPPFSAKVGSWATQIYCVDGFAGTAKYDDGTPGSPLMMAQLSDRCASWTKPVNLKLINVESNPQHFKSLEYITEAWASRGVVKNLPGDFSSRIPEILSDIGDNPTLFFIDPYGPTQVLFSHLRPILNRSQRVTELVINFDADGLRRIADTMNADTTSQKTFKTVQTNLGNVSEIIGSSNWKEKFEVNKFSAQDREKILLHEYMHNITNYDYHVAAYPIRESMGTSPKYYFVFCTRHADGIVLMNSFIREEEDEIFIEARGNRHPLFEAEGTEYDVALKERRSTLKTHVLHYMSEALRSTRRDIKRSLIPVHFGQFHDKDYAHVIYELVREDKLLSENGKKRFNDLEPLHFNTKHTDG